MFRQLHKDLCFQCKSHLNKCRSMFPSTRKEYRKEGWKRMARDGWRKRGGTDRKRERRMECKCVLKSYHTLMGPSREWKQGEFNCRKKETQSVPRLAFRRARNVDFLQKKKKRNLLGYCQDVANSTLRFLKMFLIGALITSLVPRKKFRNRRIRDQKEAVCWKEKRLSLK